MKKFWNDESGFVVSVELVLIATILVIGLVTGLTMLRDAVLAELADTANAIGSVDQGFGVAGTTYLAANGAETAQFGYIDVVDSADKNPGVASLPTGAGLAVVTQTYTPNAQVGE